MDTVLPHLLAMINDTDNVALWIELLHPKIDDGNNLGVDVQFEADEIISEASVRIPVNTGDNITLSLLAPLKPPRNGAV